MQKRNNISHFSVSRPSIFRQDVFIEKEERDLEMTKKEKAALAAQFGVSARELDGEIERRGALLGVDHATGDWVVVSFDKKVVFARAA